MRLAFVTFMATLFPAMAVAAEPEPLAGKAASAANAALLEKKLAELKALQAEIRQLRKTVPANQPLLISVQMLEVSPKRFQAAGEEFDFSGLTPGLTAGGDKSTESAAGKKRPIEAGMVLDARQLRERLKQWSEKRLVKVVAEPKIVTVSGRPAHFMVGGTIPLPNKANRYTYRDYGTQVDVVARVDDDASVRLDLQVRQSCLDSKYEVVVEGQKVPGIRTQQIDTAAQLLSEQVLVVGTFAGDRPDAERSPEASELEKAEESGGTIAFIVLAQVELVDGTLPVMPEVSGQDASCEHAAQPMANYSL